MLMGKIFRYRYGKRQIISLYEEDFKKIDASGRISALYHAIPAHLAKDARKYRITTAIGKRNNTKAEELLYELIDSKTVLPCYNSTNPRVSLTDTKDFDSYKLYLSDTGLFVTLMFIDRPVTEMIFMRSYFPINYRQIWDIFMRICPLK